MEGREEEEEYSKLSGKGLISGMCTTALNEDGGGNLHDLETKVTRPREELHITRQRPWHLPHTDQTDPTVSLLHGEQYLDERNHWPVDSGQTCMKLWKNASP